MNVTRGHYLDGFFGIPGGKHSFPNLISSVQMYQIMCISHGGANHQLLPSSEHSDHHHGPSTVNIEIAADERERVREKARKRMRE